VTPFNQAPLGSVDNSYSEGLRPATRSRDPEILLNAQRYRTEIDRSGSREQVAGRRDPNCQQTLNVLCVADHIQPHQYLRTINFNHLFLLLLNHRNETPMTPTQPCL